MSESHDDETRPQRRSTLEWPARLRELRITRVVGRPGIEVATELRVRPERAIQLGYGQEATTGATVASLSLHPPLSWVHIPVRVTPISAVGPRSGVVITLQWQAIKFARAFPAMEAELSVHATGAEECELILDGHYEPPLGIVGELFDVLIGRFVAGDNARSFVDHVADGLEREPRPLAGSSAGDKGPNGAGDRPTNAAHDEAPSGAGEEAPSGAGDGDG